MNDFTHARRRPTPVPGEFGDAPIRNSLSVAVLLVAAAFLVASPTVAALVAATLVGLAALSVLPVLVVTGVVRVLEAIEQPVEEPTPPSGTPAPRRAD
jgi:hypothetical protein